MDTNEGLERQASNDSLNEALDDTKASAARSGGREARLERLEEYELASVNKADPLEAVIGFANADLLNISFRLGDALKDDDVQLAASTLNDLLRVTRQVDRFAQLETRLTKARVQAENAKHHWQSTAKLDDAQLPPRLPH